MPREPKPVLVLENPRRVRGLFAAAITAWAMIAVMPSLFFVIVTLTTGTSRAAWFYVTQMVHLLEVVTIVGLPLALIVCVAVGYPVWRVASARGLARRRDAIIIGALVGAVVCLLLTAASHIATYTIGHIYSVGGRPSTLNEWSNGVQVVKNNLPTWAAILDDLYRTLFFAAAGAVSGLAAWWAGGEKSRQCRSETA